MKDAHFTKINDSDLESIAGGVGSGGAISSGSFASSTGTQLNIVVYWTVRADSFGQKNLDVTVSSSSYSLFCTGSAGGVELTVNGMTFVSGSPAIQYGGNSMVMNTLASFSVPNLSGPVTLSAVWHFNGTYSNIPIGDIRATGTVIV